MVHDIAMRVLADVEVYQPDFVARDFAEGVLKNNLAVLCGFNLGTGKYQTCFYGIR